MTRLKAEDQQKVIDECKAEIENSEDYMLKYQGLLDTKERGRELAYVLILRRELSNAERMLELIIEGEK